MKKNIVRSPFFFYVVASFHSGFVVCFPTNNNVNYQSSIPWCSTNHEKILSNGMPNGGTMRRNKIVKHASLETRRMMFDQLSSSISEVAKKFGGKKRITQSNIKPALKTVRRALLDADVNLKVVKALIEGVKKRSVGVEVLEGVSAEQQFIKAMNDELLEIMGGGEAVSSTGSGYNTASELARGSTEEPSIILLAGLQGAGKTTAAAKLALYLKEREVDYKKVEDMGEEGRNLVTSRMPTTERKVLLVAADVYRPAAIKQLQILGGDIGVEVFSVGTDVDPVLIAKQAKEHAIENGYDTILIDTAGRQVIDEGLMTELKNIQTTINPTETLLVVDAMTGQEAASLTASFDSAVGLTGAILTKLDGDSRGGAAVSVRFVSGKPIKFVGTGERVQDLEPFYPDRMASRILGMGDVVSLVEKAAQEVSDAEALQMQQKMLEAKFDFDDFLKQSKLVNKMGNFAGVAKMMPGVSGMVDNSKIKQVEQKMKISESLIFSMTKKERANPDLLITDKTARSRIIRITRGSGRTYEEGLGFIGEFQRMRTMMSRMQKQAGAPGADPAMAGAPPQMGNRAMRRAQKKNKKAAGGAKRGFG